MPTALMPVISTGTNALKANPIFMKAPMQVTAELTSLAPKRVATTKATVLRPPNALNTSTEERMKPVIPVMIDLKSISFRDAARSWIIVDISCAIHSRLAAIQSVIAVKIGASTGASLSPIAICTPRIDFSRSFMLSSSMETLAPSFI